MSLSVEAKSKVIRKFQTKEKDTGSTEVQIGILTGNIESLSAHFKAHVKDHHSRRGLLRMVARRKKLLDYLKRHCVDRYQKLVTELGIRK